MLFSVGLWRKPPTLSTNSAGCFLMWQINWPDVNKEVSGQMLKPVNNGPKVLNCSWWPHHSGRSMPFPITNSIQWRIKRATRLHEKFKKIIYNMIQGYSVQEVGGVVKPVHNEQSTLISIATWKQSMAAGPRSCQMAVMILDDTNCFHQYTMSV